MDGLDSSSGILRRIEDVSRNLIGHSGEGSIGLIQPQRAINPRPALTEISISNSGSPMIKRQKSVYPLQTSSDEVIITSEVSNSGKFLFSKKHRMSKIK